MYPRTIKDLEEFMLLDRICKPPVDSLVSDDSVISTITADLSLSMGVGKDSILMQAINNTGESGFMLLNSEAFRHRGRFERYPDGTEIFYWDEKPLIQFQPVEIKQEGLKITANQPYRLLSRCGNGETGEFCGTHCRYYILGTCKNSLRVAVREATDEI
jgi:hypothetical protein